MISSIIDESSAGTRIDVFTADTVEPLSRASAQKLCDLNLIKINGKMAKPSDKLKTGDTVEIDYDPEKQFEYPKIDLPIIYEDDDCVVINKPIGLLSHSKGAFNPEPTVATWLKDHTKSTKSHSWEDRDGIVHRLDRATSGVMICAKKPEALHFLQKQFSQRKVKKTYIAVIEGNLKNEQAVIDMPIERNPKAPATFRVGTNGKAAITRYKVLDATDRFSLIELKPETGRTHQLRVHLAHLGHPIVGDIIYKGKAAERLYLHAKELEITLPNKVRKIFEAPVPAVFKELIKNH